MTYKQVTLNPKATRNPEVSASGLVKRKISTSLFLLYN
jgi:hypothetical protein